MAIEIGVRTKHKAYDRHITAVLCIMNSECELCLHRFMCWTTANVKIVPKKLVLTNSSNTQDWHDWELVFALDKNIFAPNECLCVDWVYMSKHGCGELMPSIVIKFSPKLPKMVVINIVNGWFISCFECNKWGETLNDGAINLEESDDI